MKNTEQYPMPAMTEQERQELIKNCKREIGILRGEIELSKRFGVPCLNYQHKLEIQQIALAALTAPPVQVLRPVELPDSQKKARIEYTDDSFGYEG